MTAAELTGGFDLPVAGELLTHLEDHYLRRVGELPEATQQLILVAAAEPLGDSTLVLRAGRTLDIGTDALAPAEAAGLLEFGERVRFRHPLVRSAVHRAAPLSGRQRVHEVLAEVTDPDDTERRAWHRALAAPGPDEDVAAELERSAGRAQARGGVAATAAFLQHAVALTPDSERRCERALTAAQAIDLLRAQLVRRQSGSDGDGDAAAAANRPGRRRVPGQGRRLALPPGQAAGAGLRSVHGEPACPVP